MTLEMTEIGKYTLSDRVFRLSTPSGPLKLLKFVTTARESTPHIFRPPQAIEIGYDHEGEHLGHQPAKLREIRNNRKAEHL